LLGEPIGNALAAPLGIKPSPPPGIADTVEKESGEATLRRDAASAIGWQPSVSETFAGQPDKRALVS
jgi:hypothetical protein